MNLNDMNNLNGLTILKKEYSDYDKNEINKDLFLNKNNILLDNLTNLIILKSIKSMKENNLNTINYENVTYIIDKKKVYDYLENEIGVYNPKKKIKFINDSYKQRHIELKKIIDENESYELISKEIKDKIKLTDISETYLKEYENLPDYNNSNMNSIFKNKVEFNTDIIDNKETCIKEKFILKPPQIFLKNFMSNNTIYNSILLFHGTGTGKTCSAITIAENFNNNYKFIDNKPIVLSPKNIIQNWKDTIYDNTKKDNQCTGNIYNDKIIDSNNIINESRIIINKSYEIMGYRKFSNLILSKLDLDLSLNKITQFQIDIIKKNFDNRLIIIDEVHNIRDETETKDIMKLLKIIVKYSSNIKLILLSATPMFNSSFEIVNIINLMLLNDNRESELIDKKDIFDENGSLLKIPNDKGINPVDLLNRILRGYISYSRGENPKTFPMRLYPKNIDYPDYNYKGDKLNENKLSFLQLFGSTLDKPDGKPPLKGEITQTKIYYNELEKIKTKDNLQIADEIKFMQISNIVYPFQKYFTGEMGLKMSMIINIKENHINYRYQKPTLDKFGPIFDQKHIGKYSKKIENIINIVKKSTGIVFIYSQYIKSGIVPLALALEHAGYAKFNSEPLLNYPDKDKPISYDGLNSKNKSLFKRGNYIILSSIDKLSSNMDEEIKLCKLEANKDGQNIKIILGTSVASEGLDFKNIRMIHIMDPWHHLNRLEQVIGRGIRYCSHIDLPEEDRNVLVFLHALQTYDNKKETTDITIYRYAEKKAKNIGEIEMILKKNAIDCNIFNKKDENLGDITCNLPLRDKGNNIVKIKVSQNDKPYSKICSYSNECDYECIDNNNKPNKEKNMDTLDVSLFKPVLYQLCEYIKILYKDGLSYTMEEIIVKLRDIGIKCEKRVIYLSLRIMTKEKNKYTEIKINDIIGYLNYIGNIYIFKPLDIKDTKLPMVYRYNNIEKVDEYIDTGKKKRNMTKKKTTPPKTTPPKTIIINIDKLKIYFNRELNDKKFINNIDEKYLKYYILDRLTINDKENFLDILIDKIYKGEYSSEGEEKYVFDHFERNLIYKGSDIGKDSEYVFDITNESIKSSSIKPVGYYLYDGTTFIYYLLIDGSKPKKLDKDDEKSDDIKKWLQIYSKTPEYYKRYKEYIQGKIWGYISANTKKQYIFKLVDRNISSLPGFRAKGHRDCNGQQTGDLSRNILKSLDQETDKEYINKEIDNILYSKGGLSRSIACIYLELVMREMNLIYNYDNVIMMKI
jgi:superfamily II DNA or RNA helicase